MMRWIAAAPLLFVFLAILVQPPPAQREPLVVFAASSLTNVLQAAASEYEWTTGRKVVVNAGASNSQARQIMDGAPADLFCSADQPQMDALVKAGKVADPQIFTLAFNQLVVIVPSDRKRTLSGPGDLLDSSIARIAVGDPAAVPVGVYARRYLERVGLWTRLQPKIVPTINVRAALAAVDAGNADAAFVYATDAAIAKRASIAFEVPRDEVAVAHPCAVLAAARATAGEFRAFLTGPAGRAIVRRFGFIVPP